MTFNPKAATLLAGIVLLPFLVRPVALLGCSTFKLQKGNRLLYGHNLNQPRMDVPGQIFVNKRGIFKIGRSASEMLSKDKPVPSGLSWISRFGSVTFNTFGKDMPDGGLNEAGLFIWEMSVETEAPPDAGLPRLIQMNWMQYVLDNFVTTEEVVTAARRIAIEGWGWHFFVGDAEGRCAAIEYLKGRLVIHQGEDMPIPALFNQPYDLEMDLARYFRGFGGLYAPNLADKRIPRFVKTAVLIRDYDPSRPAVEYGFDMLDKIKVNETPDWSVLADVRGQIIYYKTARNSQVKKFSMESLDFSNATPALIQNMDLAEGGDTGPFFRPATETSIREFLASLPLPADLYASYGLTKDEFIDRFATHARAAEDPSRQFFRGTWKTALDKNPKSAGAGISLELTVNGDAVRGRIRNSQGEDYALDHLHLMDSSLSFTFLNRPGTLYLVRGGIDKDAMDLQLWGIDGLLGRYALSR